MNIINPDATNDCIPPLTRQARVKRRSTEGKRTAAFWNCYCSTSVSLSPAKIWPNIAKKSACEMTEKHVLGSCPQFHANRWKLNSNIWFCAVFICSHEAFQVCNAHSCSRRIIQEECFIYCKGFVPQVVQWLCPPPSWFHSRQTKTVHMESARCHGHNDDKRIQKAFSNTWADKRHHTKVKKQNKYRCGRKFSLTKVWGCRWSMERKSRWQHRWAP